MEKSCKDAGGRPANNKIIVAVPINTKVVPGADTTLENF